MRNYITVSMEMLFAIVVAKCNCGVNCDFKVNFGIMALFQVSFVEQLLKEIFL